MSRAAIEAVEQRRLLASVSGVVFNDANGNGAFDSGEGGAGGQTVWADYNYDAAITAGEPTAVSSAGGGYTLTTDVRSFALRLKPTAGQTQTAPRSGAPNHVVARNGALVVYNTNFGVAPTPAATSTISGRFYRDVNGNAVFDAGDQDHDAAIIWADLDDDGLRDASEPLARPENGLYTITVPNTSFKLRFSVLVSFQQTVPANNQPRVYNLTNSVALTGQDFAFTAPPATTTVISGVIYHDANRNGRRDAGEALVGGQIVYADYNYNGQLDGEGDESPGALSGNGEYSREFQNRPFALRLITTGGWTQTSPANGQPHYVALQDGRLVYYGADFGVAPPVQQPGTATVSGTIYLDANGNGRRDAGESAPTSYIEPYLDLDHDGEMDPEERDRAVYTSSTGQYVFSNVPRGVEFVLRISTGFGYAQTEPALFGERRFTATGPTHTVGDIGLGSGVQTVGIQPFVDRNGNGLIDGGDTAAAVAQVWVDADRNGIRTPNEPLLLDLSGKYPSAIPAYQTLLPAGTWRIAYRLAGDSDTRADGSVEAVVPTQTPSGQLIIPVPIGQAVVGYVYLDANRDGTRQPDETTAGGQTVWADYDYDGAIDAGEPTAVTGASGAYTLNVDVRSFALRLKPAAGFTQTAPAANQPHYVAASGGRIVYYNASFGVAPSVPTTTSVVGYVYYDQNHNGVRDAGEPGLSGFTVFLDRNHNGRPEESDVSAPAAEDGSYRIDNVPVGTTYSLLIIPWEETTGWIPTSPAFGTTRIITTTADPLRSDIGFDQRGGTITSLNFVDLDADGQWQLYEPETSVLERWIDLNGDNRRDAREPLFRPGETYAQMLVPPVSFINVPYGTWTVAYRYFGDTDPFADGTVSVTITPEAPRAAANVALPRMTPVITGNVFSDDNGNGQRDPGEPGLSNYRYGGYEMWLDYDDDGVLEQGEPLVYTDYSGHFAAAVERRAGTLRVRPHSYFQTFPAGGAGRAFDFTNASVPIVSGYDFGVATTPPSVSSVQGTVYVDVIADATMQSHEPQAGSGHLVWLDLNGNKTRDIDEPQTTTQSNGRYRLDYAPGASGTVHIVPAPGYVGPTTQFAFQAGSVPGLTTINLPVVPTVNAGRITGNVFADTNRNGNRDAGEVDVGGQLVWADYDYDGIVDADEPSAVTEGMGAFTIALTRQTGFALRVVPNGGRVQTSPGGGGPNWVAVRDGRYVFQTTNFGLAAP